MVYVKVAKVLLFKMMMIIAVMQKGEPMQKQKFDEIVSYFNKKVSEMEIETKYKMELLGMVTALGCAHEKETHDKRTGTHACDCISRWAAIKAIHEDADWLAAQGSDWQTERMERDKSILKSLPSAEPDLSEYSDKLWKAAYERGRADAQAERKTGQWVSVGCVVPNIANVPMIKCTVCGHVEPDVDAARTPYCPHCGSRMKEG